MTGSTATTDPTGSTKTTATVKTTGPNAKTGRGARTTGLRVRTNRNGATNRSRTASVRVSRKTATAKAVSVKNGIEATAPVGREPTTPDSKKTGKKIIRATTLPNRRALSA